MEFIKSLMGKKNDFTKLASLDNKYLDSSMKLIKKWSEHYSDAFIQDTTLPKEQIDIVPAVISIFSEICYVRYLEKPGQWTESTVKDACKSVMPKNITNNEYLSKKIIPILCNFMQWMSSKNYLSDTKKLQSAILSIKDEIPNEGEGFELVEDKVSVIGSEENTQNKQNYFSHTALFMTDDSGNLIELSESSSELALPKEEQDVNTIEDIMDDFYYLTLSFPRAAYKYALQRQQEITPFLLDVLDRDITNYKSLEDNYTGHLYSLFLLAKFREKKAIPLIVRLFKLPEEAIYKLLKGIVVVNLYNIVASICGSDLQVIQQIIEDPKNNCTSRGVALRSLLTLVNENIIERNFIVDYIKKLFKHPDFINNDILMTSLVLTSHDLYPKEMYEEIKEVLKSKQVINLIDLKKIDAVLELGEDVAKKNFFTARYHFITDQDLYIIGLLDYLEQRKDEDYESEDIHVPYRHSTPKVGRNELCPCGSGKKFKKCCLLLN